MGAPHRRRRRQVDVAPPQVDHHDRRRLARLGIAGLFQGDQLRPRHLVLQGVGQALGERHVHGDDLQPQALGRVRRGERLGLGLDQGERRGRDGSRVEQRRMGRVPVVGRAVVRLGRDAVAVALVEDPRRLQQHHLGVDVRVRQHVARVERDVVDRPQIVDGELEGPGVPDHHLGNRLLDLLGDHLAQPLGVDRARGDQDLSQRAPLDLLVLGADRVVENAAVDHPRGDQQVAQLGCARRLGRDQPAAVEADHRPLVAAGEQERARPPAEVDELHHVGDGDVLEAAGDSHATPRAPA